MTPASKPHFPDIFLVGAPKCGTTSIYNYFAQHPSIFVPELKEPHYFAMPEVGRTYYPVELIQDESKYLSLFRNKREEQLSVDCSPSYLQFPETPKRIHAANSEAKIVAVLRNPTQRAISHYLMDQRFGLQPHKLMECIQDSTSHPISYREYVKNGFYAEQITRYWDTFSPDQVMIIFFEDLNSDTETTVKGIFNFLGVRQDVDINYNIRANVGRQYRSSLLKRFIHSYQWRAIRSIFPNRLKASIHSRITYKTSNKTEFKGEEYVLNSIFKSDILKLEKMLGKPLKHWTTSG